MNSHVHARDFSQLTGLKAVITKSSTPAIFESNSPSQPQGQSRSQASVSRAEQYPTIPPQPPHPNPGTSPRCRAKSVPSIESKTGIFTTAIGHPPSPLRRLARCSLSSISSCRKNLPLTAKIQRNHHCSPCPRPLAGQPESDHSSMQIDPTIWDRSKMGQSFVHSPIGVTRHALASPRTQKPQLLQQPGL